MTENQDSSNPNSITDNEEVSDNPIDLDLKNNSEINVEFDDEENSDSCLNFLHRQILH